MAVPSFDEYKNVSYFDKATLNLDHLYAGYIQWLIRKQIKTAPVRELLFQIKAISDYIENTTSTGEFNYSSISLPFYKANKKIMEANLKGHDPEFTLMLAIFGGVSLAITAILIGTSFVPSLENLRWFGTIMAFLSAITLGPSALLTIEHNKFCKNINTELGEASKAVADNLKQPTESPTVNPLLSSVEKTLTSCWELSRTGVYALKVKNGKSNCAINNAPIDPHADLESIRIKLCSV